MITLPSFEQDNAYKCCVY